MKKKTEQYGEEVDEFNAKTTQQMQVISTLYEDKCVYSLIRPLHFQPLEMSIHIFNFPSHFQGLNKFINIWNLIYYRKTVIHCGVGPIA